MPYFLVICVTIVIAILGLWFAASGVEPNFILGQFATFNPRDKAFVVLVGGFLLFILGYAIWQSRALAQQSKAVRLLKGRLDGVRQEVAAVDLEQRSHDAVLLSLVGSDPDEAISLLRKRLTEAEQLALVHMSRNQAVDTDARVEDIRRHQQALREQLGEIVERRRAVEPVFSELRERQVFIERALSDFEKDEANNSIEARVKLLNDFLMQTRLRMASLESAFAQLNQLKTDYTGLQDNLGRFRSSETGIKAVTKQVSELREKLGVSLSALEQDGDKKLTDRVERIAGDKDQHVQRVEALTELFSRLAAIRNEVGGLFTKLSQTLERDMKP